VSTRYRWPAVVALVAVALPTSVLAATQLSIEVARFNGKLKATSSDLKEGEARHVDDEFVVRIQCASDLDCTRLQAEMTIGREPRRTRGDASGLTIKSDPADASLQLLYDDKIIAGYSFQKSDSQQRSAPGAIPTVSTLQDLLAYECPIQTVPAAVYDANKHVAHFLVTPRGQVLSDPGNVIDESDTVVVHVLAPKPLWSQFGVKVRRTSPARVLGTLSILGEGATIPSIEKHAGVKYACEQREFRLTAFAHGTGTVEIDVNKDDKDAAVGEFQFLVHRLYDGVFSFGAVWGKRLTQSFGLAPQGDHNVLVGSSTGDREVTYAVFFTPFIWKRRDIEKTPLWWERLNPTIGIATKGVLDHAFIGVSLDYKTLILTGGLHFQRTDVLSPDSGLQLGSSFSGTADKIPVAKKWEHGGFVGISIDLRAAASFLKTLGGTQ
jgi:hypothetical protein